jgi:hypothetical protein
VVLVAMASATGRGARLRFGRGAAGVAGGGVGRWSLGGRWRLRERRGRDLAANPERPADKSNGEGPQ